MDENKYFNSAASEITASLVQVNQDGSYLTKSTSIIRVPRQYQDEVFFSVREKDLCKVRKKLEIIKKKKGIFDDIILALSFGFFGIYISFFLSNLRLFSDDSLIDIFQTSVSLAFGLALFTYVIINRHFVNDSNSTSIDDVLEILIDPEKENNNELD